MGKPVSEARIRSPVWWTPLWYKPTFRIQYSIIHTNEKWNLVIKGSHSIAWKVTSMRLERCDSQHELFVNKWCSPLQSFLYFALDSSVHLWLFLGFIVCFDCLTDHPAHQAVIIQTDDSPHACDVLASWISSSRLPSLLPVLPTPPLSHSCYSKKAVSLLLYFPLGFPVP